MMNTTRSAMTDAFPRTPLAEALLQPRSFASRYEGARSRRNRGNRSVERVLPYGVQRHRAQVGRTAALRRYTLAPHAGASCPHSRPLGGALIAQLSAAPTSRT